MPGCGRSSTRRRASPASEQTLTAYDGQTLWARWIDLWNGDLARAEEIIHPEFALHRIPPPEVFGQAGGREGLLAWIRQTRSLFEDLRFTVEVGPIVDGEMVAGRWLAEAPTKAAFPVAAHRLAHASAFTATTFGGPKAG